MRLFLAAAVAALIGSPAIAATIPGIETYEVKLPCVSNCAEQGLARGDHATATIGIRTDGFASGARFTRGSLASFSVVAGSFTADLSELIGHGFVGQWSESLDTLPRLSFYGSTVIDPKILEPGHIMPPGRTVLFSAVHGFNRGITLTTAPVGARISATCPVISYGGPYASFEQKVAPIPLPAPILPLLAAIGGLALVARRRWTGSPGWSGVRPCRAGPSAPAS